MFWMLKSCVCLSPRSKSMDICKVPIKSIATPEKTQALPPFPLLPITIGPSLASPHLRTSIPSFCS